jgi:hypothetical protein
MDRERGNRVSERKRKKERRGVKNRTMWGKIVES